MKIYITSIILFLLLGSMTTAQKDFTKFVNVFIGTGAVDSNSLSGSNFPGACSPFGMVQLSPDTDDNPDNPCSGYNYSSKYIVGFSHTHLNGTGVADLFDFLFMPYDGDVKWTAGSDTSSIKGYRSAFDHKNESGYPGYYSVLLDDYNIKAEMTATEHCGMYRYTFGNNEPHHMVIDLEHSLDKKRPYWTCRIITSQIRIVDDHTIEGYRVLTGWADMRKVYFRAEFSRPFSSNVLKIGRMEIPNGTIANSTRLKALLNFDADNQQPLIVKVGLSSVNEDGAWENLRTEIPDFDFNRVVKETNEKWNKELSCIDIDATDKQKNIFYTGLYHAFIQPNNIADVNGNYLNTKYEVSHADDMTHYSTFSLWDTFRAAHPLYSIVQQKRTAAFINSMIRQYQTFGFLPIWQLWGSETYCMIGNHSIPVVADAILKDIPGFDYNTAYDAIKASSETSHGGAPFNVLNKFGYFPENIQSQSVSITLEIAYDDWCVAEVAKKMGKTEDYEFFIKRSEYYKNLYDNATGFFRAKDDKAAWITPFDPLKYGGNGGYPYTEGNAWQYTWFVPQNVYSMMDLMGGKEKFTTKLDEFFTLAAKPEDVNGNASGFIGQYAHGNEPSHHIIYLYDYAGEPWKAAYYASKVMNEQYTNDPAGYSGNEDCGQMSAWYIFSALGFYPVNPASSLYCIGSPQFPKAVINLPHGRRTFTISTKNSGKGNIYVQKAYLNGKPLKNCYIKHVDIINGGKLEFEMGSEPNKEWGRKGKIPDIGF